MTSTVKPHIYPTCLSRTISPYLRNLFLPRTDVHGIQSSTQEADGGDLRVPGQAGTHSENLSQNTKKKRKGTFPPFSHIWSCSGVLPFQSKPCGHTSPKAFSPTAAELKTQCETSPRTKHPGCLQLFSRFIQLFVLFELWTANQIQGKQNCVHARLPREVSV